MTDTNPYDAPSAALSETGGIATPPFYVVAKRKFWLLYLGLPGLYGIYWMYKHWANLKRSRKSDEWPVMRAIFSVFFVHSLFSEIDQRLKRESIRLEWSRGAIATALVVLMLISNVLDRLAWYQIGSPYVDIISLVLLPLLAVLSWQGQRAANLACSDVEGASNRTLTAANIIWLVFGGLLWLLILFGFYLMIFVPESL